MIQATVDVAILYANAQLAQDMDSEAEVSGNGHSAFAVIQTIEEVARLQGFTLPPRLTNETARSILIASGREGEIEYLMGELS